MSKITASWGGTAPVGTASVGRRARSAHACVTRSSWLSNDGCSPATRDVTWAPISPGEARPPSHPQPGPPWSPQPPRMPRRPDRIPLLGLRSGRRGIRGGWGDRGGPGCGCDGGRASPGGIGAHGTSLAAGEGPALASQEDGVSAFLEARGIALPVGDQSHLADAWTVHGLAARKNSLYLEALARAGVRVFPGTVDLVRRLKAGGVRAALVTASRNASVLLAEAGLAGLFDVVVDGQVAAETGLAGKPDPAMFLKAAQLLGVDPARAAVVEDATAGVESARRGGFGLVVGIDRGEQREALLAAGAHIVLGDVSQLDLGALRADPWALVYEGFDPAHEGHREALITLGNGYMGTRGAAPESSADGVHYPGTYLAGVYNRLTSNVHGRAMEDESLVNVPNWLVLDVRVGEAEWWSAGGLTTTQERRELDLRRGVLSRSAVLTDSTGRRLRLTQRRLVSMARPHVAALETTLVAAGWTGPVSIRCGVDAGVTNGNVAEYRGLADRHLRTVAAEVTEQGTILVEVETTQSQVRSATGARVTLTGTGTPAATRVEQEGDRTMHRFDLVLLDGEPVTVDKTVAVVTSRDAAFASPRQGALEQLGATQGGFVELLAGHEDAWARLWARFAVRLDADSRTQLVLNLHAFHLLQSVSPHTADVDAGVPARGLHGEGYRGHVFWDEL